MKTAEEKKVFILLKSVIFYYHGLDDEEKKISTDRQMNGMLMKNMPGRWIL